MQILSKRSVVIILLLLTAIILPFNLGDYWIYVLTISFYYVILAASWNLLAGYTGQFSLAQHTFSLMGAYTSSLLVMKAGAPIWLGVLAGLILTLFISMLVGILCLRMRDIYLALTTWAFAEVIRAYLRMDYKFTGGDRGLTTTPFFGTLEPLPYYFLLLALAALTIILISLVMRSKIGYFLRAIRNDQIAAQTMGINIVRWKIFSFMLSSGIAGIAGAFYAHSVGLVSPVLGEFNEMAMIIILVVTGGIRSQSGPVIGALTVRFFAEILREWAEVRMLILSALVILIMRFFHGGIVGFFNRYFRRMQRNSTSQGNLK